uniref:Chaperonin-like RbcX protein n=1 Tax=Leersia perrieri TaxID=77586 RepID=A0A0D9X0I8_9ORYZ
MAVVPRLATTVACLPSAFPSSHRAMAAASMTRWGRRRRTLARRRGRRPGRGGGVVIVGEFGGQYEEGYEDVHTEIVNYFTYKATHTVLNQLYEMNPPAYTWLYNYVVVNDPKEGKHFLVALAKERQDLAERVMITRLHLYGKWVKKCDHAKMYEKISNENLEIMRQRLMETVAWPTDETNTGDTAK